METERLRQFCLVADSGSLTKAAEVLNISLGGLSKSLKVLEEEIGYSLFTPAGRGLAVSERGLLLYKKARKVLEAVTELNSPVDAPQKKFRVGALEVFAGHFLAKVLQGKDSKRPLEIVEASPGELEGLIAAKQVDCGLTYLPHPRAGVETLKIGSFELNAFGMAQFSAKERSIHELPFIVPSSGLSENPLGIKERDGWPDDTTKRNRFHSTNMLSAALDMARQGLGVVYMPDFVARAHNETHAKAFHLIPVSATEKLPRVKREVFLLKRNGSEETSEIKRLVSGVKMHLRG